MRLGFFTLRFASTAITINTVNYFLKMRQLSEFACTMAAGLSSISIKDNEVERKQAANLTGIWGDASVHSKCKDTYHEPNMCRHRCDVFFSYCLSVMCV